MSSLLVWFVFKCPLRFVLGWRTNVLLTQDKTLVERIGYTLPAAGVAAVRHYKLLFDKHMRARIFF